MPCYSWLYPETVHVLRRSPWNRAISLKWGTDKELDELEHMLKNPSHHVTALFCEIPSNIKFISPNIERIRQLADEYNFIVACDETAGNFVNLDILPFVDVVLSSLTKMFSGASDVTGGRFDTSLPSTTRRYTCMKTLTSVYTVQRRGEPPTRGITRGSKASWPFSTRACIASRVMWPRSSGIPPTWPPGYGGATPTPSPWSSSCSSIPL